MTERPKRTHQPHWQDATRAERQRRRQAALNDLARAAGFDSWRKLETAAINGDITLTANRNARST